MWLPTTLVHRYLMTTDNGMVIMKGDNHRVAETIPRYDIMYEVIGVTYDRN